ncbi:thrombospondin type-1 domain-containing protein 4-like [Teleopsis dalmanni]|uniref:thrombospondin type-1 domain-containing protein 4-like n=1 Tax=Teleopsis dalmanni TaxID=139649 RepID=UPI0018CF9CA7|nr:thrombospondin type-1 domain-containing protein 4-like [Teleopsis dalmanni]
MILTFERFFILVVCLFYANTELRYVSTTNIDKILNTSTKSKKLSKTFLKSAITDDNEDDYNDYIDENEGAKQSHQRNIAIIRRIGITYSWSKWDKWSKCTNSCVQIKKRKCIQSIQNSSSENPIENAFYPDLNGQQGCFGLTKKYRMCKDEKCKLTNNQFRDEQCSDFNTISYKGKFFNWIGYEKEHNECELFCRPIDSENFISMNRSVTDGTPCEKPAVYYTHAYRRKAVCIEGICRAVHSSGVIRPATTYDSTVKCGSVLCQVVSELYNKTKENYGYNFISTIPTGAMNLTIKQVERSDNLLALKSMDDIFIIHGDNHGSESGIFEYNDDIFEYNRELGIITSKGPLSKAIVLMLYFRGINPGVQYDYTIPVPSASITEDDEQQSQWNELGDPLDYIDDNNIDDTVSAQLARTKNRKRRKFSWKLLGFGQCNRSCGPGVQSPIFRCIRDSQTRFYSPKRCAFAEKPVFSEDIYHCNRGLCPAYWRASEYSECKCNENKVNGTRQRYASCVQEQLTGKIEEVKETQCEKLIAPDLIEVCSCPKQIRRRIYERRPDKAPKVYSRLIGTPAIVRSVYNSTMPLRRNLRDDRSDKAGVWLMSEWNKECSAECGLGYEHRTIYCDRTPPYTDLCDLRYTPEQKRACSARQQECQEGTWFASEWSNCTGECFNLQRKRIVICLRDGNVVDDEECDAVGKPKEVSNCTHREVNYCGPKWHYSEWSECSRSCGEGTQRRYAKCLEFDWKQNAMVESNNCKYLEREPVYAACNVHKCEELNTPMDVAQNDNTTPTPDDCSDEFPNCKRINRQRLCKLQFYKSYCCQSCIGYY